MRKKLIIKLDQLTKYLEPLLDFCNCHMVDFFTNNVYQNFISLKIRQEIDNLGFEQSLNFILNHKVIHSTSKTNLDTFLSESKNHTLTNLNDICISLNDFQLKLIDFGCQNLSGLHLKTFMTSKKSHEVQILSEISSAVCQIAKTNFVVDIGDGKGYLSSALALNNGLKVLGIDSSQINTKSAEKRINKMKKAYKNDSFLNGSDNYKQMTDFVTEEADLISLVRDRFLDNEIDNISLVGLHTCGNLAANCLKIFANNPNISSICNVGCCYHLISENCGFPLSNYLKEKRFHLDRNAKMLSCQSLNRIIYNKELPSDVLFYRALLQILLGKYHPNLIEKHVGRLKKPSSFLNYVQEAFKKFNTELKISEREISDLFERYLPMQKYLQVFYLIRAHLAPVIETLILLDRLLFLYEQNFSYSYLVQLFDPVISPRCYGIISFKNSCFIK